MVALCVNAGVCKNKTNVLIDTEDCKHVVFEINSQCQSLKAINDCVFAVNSLEESEWEHSEFRTGILSKKHCIHACPVPGAIMQGIQFACGNKIDSDDEVNMMRL